MREHPAAQRQPPDPLPPEESVEWRLGQMNVPPEWGKATCDCTHPDTGAPICEEGCDGDWNE